MNKLDDKGMGSTRVKMSLICIAAATIAIFSGKVNGAEYINFLIWIAGMYGGTEVGAKLASAWSMK